MIITVLGGSSQSTPVLVDELAAAAPETSITVRLAGRNLDRLRAVERACGLLAKETRIAVEIFAESSWQTALKGSDMVLLQPRIGGYEGREFDEAFPLLLGVPGDEGLGPGGLSAAYRGWPTMRALFSEIHTTAPQARAILLTSPASLLVRLAHLEFPGWPLSATCELPWTTLQQLCRVTGTLAEQVSFTYQGVNHLGFLTDVRAPEDLLDLYAQTAPRDSFPSPALVHRLGAFPLKYLRLHFCREAVVEEQRRQRMPRARMLAELAEAAFRVFRSGDIAAIRRALGMRPAPWYSQAVVPMVLAEMGRPVPHPVFLSTADEAGEVVERPFHAERRAWTAIVPSSAGTAAASAEVGDILGCFRAYEAAAAEAVREGTGEALEAALALHPWVRRGDEQRLARCVTEQRLTRARRETRELCPS